MPFHRLPPSGYKSSEREREGAGELSGVRATDAGLSSRVCSLPADGSVTDRRRSAAARSGQFEAMVMNGWIRRTDELAAVLKEGSTGA